MDYKDYLSTITGEEIDDVLQTSPLSMSQEEYVNYLLGLDDKLKVLFITRGLMFMCLELEFKLTGDQLWEAVSFYDMVVNSTSPVDPSTEYYN